MLSCINKNSYEFQTLKQRSGLNEFMLEAVCRRFVSEYNRFPYLDELPNSNSETSLREALNIKNNIPLPLTHTLSMQKSYFTPGPSSKKICMKL